MERRPKVTVLLSSSAALGFDEEGFFFVQCVCVCVVVGGEGGEAGEGGQREDVGLSPRMKVFLCDRPHVRKRKGLIFFPKQLAHWPWSQGEVVLFVSEAISEGHNHFHTISTPHHQSMKSETG